MTAASTRTPDPARPPTRDTILEQLTTHIRELTQPHTTLHRWRTWTITRNPVWHERELTVPALLTQLADTAHNPTRRGPRIGPRPTTPTIPINTKAVDATNTITTGARRWITQLGAPPVNLYADLRALAAVAPILDDRPLEQLAADLAAWHDLATRATQGGP